MDLLFENPQPLEPVDAQALSKSYLQNLNFSLGDPQLKNLDSPLQLKNIEKACQRIIQAIDRQEKITLITDHDCDGQNSCAVLVWALRNVFDYTNFDYYISHRTKEGYGITPGLLERIGQNQLATLVITADCGISSHEAIAQLKSHSVDVIVTDHHSIPAEGVPTHAFTVINPQQEGCEYPDKNIAGCFVAWLVMAAVRNIMQQTRCIKLPSLAHCLDYVTIATISDCMDLRRSLNNRIVIKHGLKLIRKRSKPVWRALLTKYPSYLTCEFLSFKLIPLLNADGRLNDALTAVKYLISNDLIDAQHHLAHLIDTNENRKILSARQMEKIYQRQIDSDAIVVNLAGEGHCGIHGITANKICQEKDVPTIIFSQSFQTGLISGSARSPDTISLKTIFDDIDRLFPDLIEQYGGHHQAAGITLKEENFLKFKTAFLKEVTEKSQQRISRQLKVFSVLYGPAILQPKFWLEFESLLEPFGKEFDKPLFAVIGKVTDSKTIGEQKNHLCLTFKHCSQELKALFFFQQHSQEMSATLINQEVMLIGHFNYDVFNRNDSLSLYLQGLYHLSSNRLYLKDDYNYLKQSLNSHFSHQNTLHESL